MKNFTFTCFFLAILNFQAFAQSTAYGYPDIITSSNSFIPWWDTQNGLVADGVNITTEICPNAPSDTLRFTDFDFNIPPNATILGVTLNMGKAASGANQVKDGHVYLINNGIISNNIASSAYWNTVLTYAGYGGSNNLWGSTLTPAIVNSPDFGFSIQLLPSTSLCENAWIDYAYLSVTYIIPFECEYSLEIQEEQQCSNFYMFNTNSPPFDAEIQGLWYFGEGDVESGGYFSEHYYATPGVYDGYVTFSSEGCPDSTINFTIEAMECNDCIGEVSYYESDICGDFTFEVAVFEPNVNAQWYFGDNTWAEAGSFIGHTYEEPGTYNGYVTYTSDQCGGAFHEFTVVVEPCENDCTIEMFWNEITCEYYSLTAETNHPDAVVSWSHDGVFIGTGFTIEIPFPDEGVHVICASYETPECPEGVEVCSNFDVDFGDCYDCPEEVFIEAQDDCGDLFLTVLGDETGNVDWDFGDGDYVFGGSPWIGHVYQPGTYAGSAVYYSETCEDTYIPFTVVVEDCDDCEDNQISLSWSVEQFGSDQGFEISLFEVGENINSLEYISSGECFASDFSSCDFDYCLEEGCYAVYISSQTEFEVWDFNLALTNNGNPMTYTMNGTSPTVGLYYYFSIGDVSCPFEDNCILEYGYEILEDGTYVFSALTNSTADVVWDFGDGTTGTGWPIEHVFAEAGEYEVCVAFANDDLCSNEPTCGIVYVENDGECTDVVISIEYDLTDEELEVLEFTLEYQGIDIQNENISLPSQVSLVTLSNCLMDGCYAFEIIPSDPIYDLSGVSISVTIPGNPPIVGTYDETTNSITLLFGINDDACATSNIDENSIENLLIYPNPVANMLNIQVDKLHDDLHYDIINVLGQVVLSGELVNANNQLQVNALVEGHYQLVIKNQNAIRTKAIHIKR